jgi:hypothetical protein
MHSYLSQDLITMRGATSVTTITQAEGAWLDLFAYEDIVCWLDVKEVTTGGGTVQMSYETSPSKDDSLFVAMPTPLTLGTLGLTPTAWVLSALTTFQVPLARWFRWKLMASGGTLSWDVTFRLWVSANSNARRRQGTAAAGRSIPMHRTPGNRWNPPAFAGGPPPSLAGGGAQAASGPGRVAANGPPAGSSGVNIQGRK